jgi:E3 ubiquitin-protein ligase synoviolin
MRWYSRRPVLDTTTPPATGRVGQADALREAGAVPQGVAPPFGPAADAPQPPAGHLGNLFRNMVRGPPPAPPPAPYPPVQPQQFAAGGPPPPHYQWGAGFAHQPMGPHYMQPQPPPQLQPAPVFQGFYGPGGVWQPWGDRRLVEGVAPQHRPAPQQQQDAPLNNARAAVAPAPAPATPATEEGERSTSQREPPEDERPISQGTSSAPREAAALAALRRLSPGTPSTQNQDPLSTPSVPSVPPTATTQATIPPPTSSAPPRSTSTAPQPTSATPTPNRNVNVPSLIPMSFSPGGAGPRPANAPLPSPPIVYRTAPLRHALPARPLATLPPTLTDAQLTHLDVLTREAIDERLRVLEGISSTMYRCVEELTRLRSVLPVSTGPGPASTLARSQPGPGQQGSTTQTAVNESNNAPDLRPLDSGVKLDVSSDVSSSNAKSDADVSGASSSSVGRSDEANGNAPAPAN